MALDAIQPQIEKCLTSSGCKVPGGEHAKNSTKQQCRQDIQAALKAQVLACVRKSDPGFDFPHEEESPENMKKDINKKDFLKACGGSKNKTKDVDACLKKSLPKQTITPEQQKQRFDDNCQKKNECETALGPCRPQFEALKKVVCQCNQDARLAANVESTRASTPSCGKNSTESAKKGQGKHHNEGTKRPCADVVQEKDWCAAGYDAWKAGHTKKPDAGGKKKGGQ